MDTTVRSYIGIVVFEISRVEGESSFFREDIYLVLAKDDDAAMEKVREMAVEQEQTRQSAENSTFVKVRHIVDVAPTLYGISGDKNDLYSRHFASLDVYAEFEMKLGGTDPLIA